jgi:hypothetical protein
MVIHGQEVIVALLFMVGEQVILGCHNDSMIINGKIPTIRCRIFTSCNGYSILRLMMKIQGLITCLISNDG